MTTKVGTPTPARLERKKLGKRTHDPSLGFKPLRKGMMIKKWKSPCMGPFREMNINKVKNDRVLWHTALRRSPV